MLFSEKNSYQKREDFKAQLETGKLLRFPGSFAPIVSMMIEMKGFEGVYISGAVLSADLGLPDIGLTTLTEVAQRGRAIARTTNLPSIIDIDTGFGAEINVARTIQEIEELGMSACQIEDQLHPKRCGHLDNKELVSLETMTKRIKSAVDARRDPNFLIIARTDARADEGLDRAIDRAKAYVDAGADIIFPEALKNEREFEVFREAISQPLLANMTEFGKSKLLTTEELSNLGYNIVLYPVTLLRIALGAVEKGLDVLDVEGTQESLLNEMQTRKRLYEILQYEKYNHFDKDLFNFKL